MDSDSDSLASMTLGDTDSDSDSTENMPWLPRSLQGRMLRPSISNPPDISENSSNENAPGVATFDVNLPVRHSYLGADLKELSGCTLYDENTIVTIPLLVQKDSTVALPGQILPLKIYHPPTIDILRSAIQNDRTFGVVWQGARDSDSMQSPLVGVVGVTAEVYEHRENDRGPENFHRGYGLLTKCRQRFKVIEVIQQIDSTFTGRVLILPEVILPNLVNEGCARKCSRLSKERTKKAFSSLTQWPSWVHSMYDEKTLITQMKSGVNEMRQTAPQSHEKLRNMMDNGGNKDLYDDSVQLPMEAGPLSYWVAQNLPLVNAQRIVLLKINSSLQRLRWELSFLSKCQNVCCQVCGEVLTTRGEMFSMSVEGPQGTYVNPSGYVHETLTVMNIDNVITVGMPCSDYSWFPGYLWTVVQCASCNHHIGWKFNSSVLHPSRFWGISRRSIVTLLQRGQPEEEFRPIL